MSRVLRLVDLIALLGRPVMRSDEMHVKRRILRLGMRLQRTFFAALRVSRKRIVTSTPQHGGPGSGLEVRKSMRNRLVGPNALPIRAFQPSFGISAASVAVYLGPEV